MYVERPQDLSSQPLVAPEEARHLEFFQSKTAPELEGALSGGVWSKLVLKACQEKPVLHAVVALSSLHEHYKKFDALPESPALEFSMQQYNKAIHEVMKLDLNKSSTATHVALIACLLFTLFESLQDHHISSLTHVKSGIRIIYEHYTRSEAVRSDDRSLSVYLFKCLETQTLELGDLGDLRDQYSSFQIFNDIHLNFPTTFSSIEEATTSLETFRCAHMRFAEYSKVSAHLATTDVQERIAKGRQDISEALESWSRAFESMLNCSPRTKTATFQSSIPEVLLLLIHQDICKIGLCLTSTQASATLDIFGQEFQAITSHVARYISASTPKLHHGPPSRGSPVAAVVAPQATRSSGDDETSHTPEESRTNNFDEAKEPRSPPHPITPTFSMGLGIIMPLFIVCVHCREHRTRHQALHLLKICNRKEGLWDSRMAAVACEVVIMAEEQEALRQHHRVKGIAPGQKLPAAFPHDGHIPEQARIQEVSVKFTTGKRAILTYTQGGVDHSLVIV